MFRSICFGSAALALCFIGTISACATSPDESGEQSVMPNEENRDAAATIPSTTNDSGSTAKPEDAGKKDSGSSSSGGSSSGGSSSGGSSGASSSGGSSGAASSSGSGGAMACPAGDFLYLTAAALEILEPSPRMCDPITATGCAAAECCFTLYGVCVDTL